MDDESTPLLSSDQINFQEVPTHKSSGDGDLVRYMYFLLQ